MISQNGETQALLTLLTIDDEADIHRYKQINAAQPNYEAYLEYDFEEGRRRKSGKENQIFRKQILPKLNSSKEELKLILKKLESESIGKKGDISQDRALQPLKSYENQTSAMATSMKSYRNLGNENMPRELFANKYTNKMNRCLEPRSQLSFIDGRAEEIQFLIRKNNYSANALNLKTLNILHEINTKNSRCSSSLKKRAKGKIPVCIKPTKKNIVAFLRKVA